MIDVLVIGAGQAGLGIGYFLGAAGVDFTILERGRVGESWRSQRWDSFAVNTPNRMNGLPGTPYDGSDPDGYLLRDDLVGSFERHAAIHGLPIRTGTTVTAVRKADDGWFTATTTDADHNAESVDARAIVVASGLQQSPKIPGVAEEFPDTITQIHASEYRSPDAVQEGAIVIIGSAQSGCQIAEDLVAAGREVYLCTSNVGRIPRRYRGRDTLQWLNDVGFLDQTVADLPDPMAQYAAQPQVSGVGRHGRTVSLQGLQRRGIHLLGRVTGVEDGILVTDDSLADHVAFADQASAEVKQNIDAYIDAAGIDAPAPEFDEADLPAGSDVADRGLSSLDLDSAEVSTVIWCTGFTAHLDWIDPSVVDESGHPVHERGVSAVDGLYFLGFPWLHKRKSGIIVGIEEDARYISDMIVRYLADSR